MVNVGKHVVTSFILIVSFYGMASYAPHLVPSFVAHAVASPTGDACRKDVCEAAVAACMRADLSLNPLARTEAEKKVFCAQFFAGCMTRSITPDVPWYSPETVARFLKCPS
jgi:hypothetical protein